MDGRLRNGVGWMDGRLRNGMERNKMNRKWTLCEHNVIIMNIQIKTKVEKEQSEGFHLLLQEEVLELLLDPIVRTAGWTQLLFVAIYKAWFYDHWPAIWNVRHQLWLVGLFHCQRHGWFDMVLTITSVASLAYP